MNVRAHISLAILTLGCMPMPATADVTPIALSKLNPILDHLGNLSKTQITALIATLGITFWYKKRKPTPVRCTWDDFFHGRNLENVTDIIPGFPKIPGKVTINSEGGMPVEMKYQKEVKGYGLLYEIESNAKYIARAASWPAVLMGLMLVINTTKDDATKLVETLFGWLVGHNTKQKPY